MKHYKAITRLNQVISELQLEIDRLDNLDPKMDGYAGYVFIQEDKKNILSEINQLSETMRFLIKLSKK